MTRWRAQAEAAVEADLRLRRLAHVSAETGARFVRERLLQSPLDWLCSPKELLGGRAPIHACQDEDGYRRVMWLHDLALGLDGRFDQFEMLPSPPSAVEEARARRCNQSASYPDSGGDRALYTFSANAEIDTGTLQIFGAMIANDATEVRDHLRSRFGRHVEEEANVRLGFDWSEPLACALVSDALGDLLQQVAAAPYSPLATGFDFHVEQRFAE